MHGKDDVHCSNEDLRSVVHRRRTGSDSSSCFQSCSRNVPDANLSRFITALYRKRLNCGTVTWGTFGNPEATRGNTRARKYSAPKPRTSPRIRRRVVGVTGRTVNMESAYCGAC